MKIKIVTGTAQSANNIKRKNKQINSDKKKIPATNHNLRLSMQTTKKRGDDVTKTKFGLVGHVQKKRKKCSAAKHQHVAANWWGDISNVIAPMTSYKSSGNRPGSLTLRSKPFLEGLVWSHQSKPVLISLYKFVLRDWFLGREHFYFVLS